MTDESTEATNEALQEIHVLLKNYRAEVVSKLDALLAVDPLPPIAWAAAATLMQPAVEQLDEIVRDLRNKTSEWESKWESANGPIA